MLCLCVYLLIHLSLKGAYGNSPSACFVASDGQSLRLYQAVIEAKKLLSELSNPEISVSVFKILDFLNNRNYFDKRKYLEKMKTFLPSPIFCGIEICGRSIQYYKPAIYCKARLHH